VGQASRSTRPALAVVLFALCALPGTRREAFGHEALVGKARKFGARDCRFCHAHEDGGPGWNARGRWLIDEKARRGADQVAADWLADYPGEPGLRAGAPRTAPEPAQGWARFRGPNGTGAAAVKDVPVQWTEAEGLLWKVPLPGAANSSPVLWGARVFVLSSTADGRERVLWCLDAGSGARLWSRTHPGATAPLNPRNTLASSTPATDGERVYVIFWDGVRQELDAFDFAGSLVWRQDLGPWSTNHGAGVSPIVHGGIVAVANDQGSSASVLAFRARTGERLWQASRQGFEACYSTPFVLPGPGSAETLVVASTAGITGYALDGGRELWNWTWVFKGKTLRTVGSPIHSQGMVFATSGDGGGNRHAVAVRLDPGGVVQLAWETTRSLPYVPTMLALGEHLYWVNDGGIAGCTVARTGENLWTSRLGGNVIASPILVDGKVYAVNEDGDVSVFAAEPTFRLLGRGSVGELVRATPAVAPGKLLIRGANHLFCIGRESVESVSRARAGDAPR
jgi:outer membrane protein assembly factor BamB